jgi:hypothetical protein
VFADPAERRLSGSTRTAYAFKIEKALAKIGGSDERLDQIRAAQIQWEALE